MLYVPVVGIRLSADERERWRRLAAERGLNVAGLVKLAIDDLERERSGSALADRVAERVLREVAPLFSAWAPSMESASFEANRVSVFDRSCLDAELHRRGTVCPSCGGSDYSLR